MADAARPSLLGGSRGPSPASSPLLGRGSKSRSLPTPSSASPSSSSPSSASPLLRRRPPQQQQPTPPASPKLQYPTSRGNAAGPGHGFKRVTLTKPTFCHYCTDFIWGLAGYLCEVCNFMSHEKCLKHVKMPCSSVAPSLVRYFILNKQLRKKRKSSSKPPPSELCI